MLYTLVYSLFVHASLSLAEATDLGNYYGPGRADRRTIVKRQARDFGTFAVDCRNSESACNNACYYIRCQARNDPDANRIVYIGPNGNGKEASTNRVESGCNFNNPSSDSVCTNFSFSQKFSNPTATDWQCDEWPPAVHQQPAFANKQHKNSLRCMRGGENGSLGAKLGNFINNVGGPYPNRPAGAMSRGDFFRVDFLTNILTADQTKVKFCLGQGTSNCGSDGMQFGMTAKPIGGGKISASYNADKNDNLYALQNTVYKELYQCRVKFTRDGDTQITNVQLSDWSNTKVPGSTRCPLANNGDTCLLKGLPNDLRLRRTGVFGTPIEFEYAPGLANQNVNNFAWDSLTLGNGRGPWTDPPTDPNRKPLRYCKVVPGAAKNTEVTECWFPCYQHADGQ